MAYTISKVLAYIITLYTITSLIDIDNSLFCHKVRININKIFSFLKSHLELLVLVVSHGVVNHGRRLSHGMWRSSQNGRSVARMILLNTPLKLKLKLFCSF